MRRSKGGIVDCGGGGKEGNSEQQVSSRTVRCRVQGLTTQDYVARRPARPPPRTVLSLRGEAGRPATCSCLPTSIHYLCTVCVLSVLFCLLRTLIPFSLNKLFVIVFIIFIITHAKNIFLRYNFFYNFVKNYVTTHIIHISVHSNVSARDKHIYLTE